MTRNKKLLKVAEHTGEHNLLVQLAEEAAELGQAACKLHRAYQGLTPVAVEQAKENLTKEFADTCLCMVALELCGVISLNSVTDIMDRKLDRWVTRLEGNDENAVQHQAGVYLDRKGV